MPPRTKATPATPTTAPSGEERRASLRQRQAELRRDHVLDAAEEVFGSLGFTHATIREIAAAAGFSPASVYSLFEGKDELFAAIMDRHARVLLVLHQDVVASGGSVVERLHRMIDRKIDYHLEHPEFARLYQRSIGVSMLHIESLDSASFARFHQLMGVIAELFRQGVESGECHPGDPDHLTMLFSGMIEGHLARTLFDEPETPASRQELHDAAHRAFLVGARS